MSRDQWGNPQGYPGQFYGNQGMLQPGSMVPPQLSLSSPMGQPGQPQLGQPQLGQPQQMARSFSPTPNAFPSTLPQQQQFLFNPPTSNMPVYNPNPSPGPMSQPQPVTTPTRTLAPSTNTLKPLGTPAPPSSLPVSTPSLMTPSGNLSSTEVCVIAKFVLLPFSFF